MFYVWIIHRCSYTRLQVLYSAFHATGFNCDHVPFACECVGTFDTQSCDRVNYKLSCVLLMKVVASSYAGPYHWHISYHAAVGGMSWYIFDSQSHQASDCRDESNSYILQFLCGSVMRWLWASEWWSRGHGFDSHPLRCRIGRGQAGHVWVSYNMVYSGYASVTSIIHCRPCCNFLISWCRQQTPE